MPEEKKYYTCSINITDTKRRRIFAGSRFEKSELHEGTFDSLMEQSFISEFGMASPGTKKVKSTARSLAETDGPVNKTPDAALNPPPRASVSEAEEAEKVEMHKQLKDLGVPARPNCTLATLKKKLDAATDPEKSGASAAKIWNYDPEVVKDIGLACLVATYTERCKEFDFEPETSVLESEEALIEKLTSQYGE